MKKRIVELYADEKHTVSSLRESISREFGFNATDRQFLSRIKKWDLDKNTKPRESLFMVRKQQYRRTYEPEKPDYQFRVRGKMHPSEKCRRWEARMTAKEGVLSPASENATPGGVSYWTGSPANSAANSAATPGPEQSPVPMNATILRSQSPSMPTWLAVFPWATERNLAASPSPSSASTPRLVAMASLEGHSPAPWNDADEVDEVSRILTTLNPAPEGPAHPEPLDLERQEVRLRGEISELEQKHGTSSPLVLPKLQDLFLLLNNHDRYKAAAKVGSRLFYCYRRSGDNKGASAILTCLARVYHNQGLDDMADQVAMKAYTAGMACGDDCAWYSICIRARISITRSQYQNAENLLQQLLGTGDNSIFIHPSIIPWAGEPLSMRVHISLQQGRIQDAENWAIRGIEHHTLNSPNGIAMSNAHFAYTDVLTRQCRWDEAKAVANESISELKRSNIRSQSSLTFQWLFRLGHIFMGQGAWEEADYCLLALSSLGIRILGPVHHGLEQILELRFDLCAEQLMWDRAESILAKYKPHNLSSMFMKAQVLEARGKHREAYEAIRDLGTSPLEAPRFNSVMVRILRNLGRLAESEKLGSSTLEMSLRIYGDSHPETFRCMDNLARTHMTKGDAPKAIQTMKECVKLYTSTIGSEHYLTRRSQDTLAVWVGWESQAGGLAIIQNLDFNFTVEGVLGSEM